MLVSLVSVLWYNNGVRRKHKNAGGTKKWISTRS
nr:MAG TPA: hypothetical protein [Caudoviricetes sp.]